jgi:hypothetical protein
MLLFFLLFMPHFTLLFNCIILVIAIRALKGRKIMSFQRLDAYKHKQNMIFYVQVLPLYCIIWLLKLFEYGYEKKGCSMHLYIIAQYLNLPGLSKDRLFKLGQEWLSRGEQVTVFTMNEGTGLQLGRRKIGLTQSGGLNTVTFNVDYSLQASHRRKLFAYLKFARMVKKQGLQLPRPDLILAASPPLTAVWPALKLKEHFKVPLVVEIRELWPDALVQRGSLRGSLPLKALTRFEQQVYEKADRIIAGGVGIADAIKARLPEKAKVSVIPEGLDERDMIRLYGEAMAGLIRQG